MLIYCSAPDYVYSAVIPSPLNTWHHFVGITTSSQLIIYIDGIFSASATYACPNPPVQNSWYLGADNNGGLNNFWNGSLDDVRVYNRALSASEILALYNAEK